MEKPPLNIDNRIAVIKNIDAALFIQDFVFIKLNRSIFISIIRRIDD